MANINKLVKAFEAFNNKDQNAATKLFRSFFVESAQEINSKLESEDFGDADLGDDLADDVGYGLDEDFDGEGDEADKVDGDVPAVDGADIDRPADDFPIDGEGDEPADDEFAVDGEGDDAGEVPTADEWSEITAEFDELAALFADLGVTPDDDQVDGEGDEPADEVQPADDFDGLDLDEPADGEDDETDPLLGEDYGFDVPEFDNSDPASSTKSVVADGADAVVDGVEPVKIKSTKDELGNPDVKLDDYSNIQKSGDGIYKTATEQGATKDTTSAPSIARPLK